MFMLCYRHGWNWNRDIQYDMLVFKLYRARPLCQSFSRDSNSHCTCPRRRRSGWAGTSGKSCFDMAFVCR